jgi:protein SCO1/2
MLASLRALTRRLPAFAALLAGKPIFWFSFIFAMFSWPILRSIHAERALPRTRAPLGMVRNFALRDQGDAELRATELRGRLWVASFTTVARQRDDELAQRGMSNLERVRHRTRNLGDAFRLLTFTLDPERDTAEDMRELSSRHRAQRGSWRFVSGPPARVREVLRDFQVSEVTPPNRVALVDGNLAIRGYYDLADDGDVALLLRDVSRLLTLRGE